MSYSIVVRTRKFNALLIGQIISLLGDVILGAALSWYVYTLTGKATAISYLTIALVVPNLLFSLFAGPIVDRWNRRRIMITSDLIRCIALLFIPALYDVRGLSLGLLYVIVFVWGSASAFFIPARGAIMPQIFGNKDQLTSANSLMNGCFETTKLIGYPIGGILIYVLTLGQAAAFDSVTFLVSAISILIMGTVASPSIARGDQRAAFSGLRRDISEGLGYVWKNFVIRIVMISSMLGNFFISIGLGFTVVYAKDALSTNAIGYTLIFVAIGIGTASGSFLVGKVKFRQHLGMTLILSSIMAGATMIALSPQTELVAAIPIIVLLGLCLGIYNVNYINMLQATAPNRILGRVMSLDQILSYAILPLSLAIAGPLVDVMGIRTAYLWSGVMVMLIGSATFLSRKFRKCSY